MHPVHGVQSRGTQILLAEHSAHNIAHINPTKAAHCLRAGFWSQVTCQTVSWLSCQDSCGTREVKLEACLRQRCTRSRQGRNLEGRREARREGGRNRSTGQSQTVAQQCISFSGAACVVEPQYKSWRWSTLAVPQTSTNTGVLQFDRRSLNMQFTLLSV